MWTRIGQERVEHLSLHKYSPPYYVVINIFRSTGQITTARDRFRNPTTLAACQMSCPHAVRRFRGGGDLLPCSSDDLHIAVRACTRAEAVTGRGRTFTLVGDL